MKKNKTHYWSIIAIGFGLILLLAILDAYGAILWYGAGGWEGQAYKAAGGIYQFIFWGLAHIMIALIGIVYYITTKDKSESLALFLVPVILLQFGLEDVLYYALRGLNLFADTLTWLNGGLWPVTIVNHATGIPITGLMVLISSIVGIAFAIFVAIKLEKVKG